MRRRYKSPIELLAPASNLQAAITAFKCGADSVYAGLDRFNARQRGDNFSFEQFSLLVEHARSRGKKVYLTLNTLVKESELPLVVELLAKVAEIEPNAVIVQDLGILRIIRECFPTLSIHASTQMGVHNSAGIKLLAASGVERVILERQLTLDEIEATIANSPIDVEIFAHGALCCSLSGRCLVSSWMGGWSGNRGRCKQACRRRFYSANGNGFFFSTCDLYTLDLLSRFERIGVTALKIEGRLKKADYVESTVSAYRKILDTPPEAREAAVREARRDLSLSYGRKWSHGFYDETRPASLVQHESLGVSGLLCGKVTRVKNRGIEVSLSRPVSIGDKIRVQPSSGDEGPSFTVTRLSVRGRPARNARPDEVCFISCDKTRKIERLSRVFKIGRTAATFTLDTGKARRVRRLVLDVEIDSRLIAVSVRATKIRWETPLELQPARNRPLDPAMIASEFKKCRGGDFSVSSVAAKVKEGLFLLPRELRHLRRNFWRWALPLLLENPPPGPGETGKRLFLRLNGQTPSGKPEKKETVVLADSPDSNPIKGSITAVPIDKADKNSDEVLLPSFCPETRLESLKKRIHRLVEQGVSRFRACSLFGLQLLAEITGLKISASFPLPAANSWAVRELFDLNVSKATVWIEVEGDSVDEMIRNCAVGAKLEIYSYGRPPLLSTRALIPVEGDIDDGRGIGLSVSDEDGLTHLYPRTVLRAPRRKGCSILVDLRAATWGEKNTRLFNDGRQWL